MQPVGIVSLKIGSREKLLALSTLANRTKQEETRIVNNALENPRALEWRKLE